MMRQHTLAFLMILSLALKAQERLGITNSNYSSTNSIFLNPSSSVDSRTYMQLNLVGANAFAMTNIGYLQKFWYWQLIKGTEPTTAISSLNLKKYLYANASVEGPAFVMSKENFGAGIFFRARSVAGLSNVPYRVTNLILKNDQTREESEEINLKNMQFSNMSWVEYGLNFGMMVKRERNLMITMGGSLRYLTGINLAYGNISQLQGYYNDSVVSVENLTGKLRYNTPAWNSGRGVGLDVGVTFKRMLGVVDGYYAHSKKSNCKYVDYKYKVGISLRDLGYIKFDKETMRSDVNGSGYFITAVTGDDYEDQFNANFTPTTSNDPITAFLPTSMSFQFDYNFGNNFYLNTTVVKNWIFNGWTGVQAPNLISVCPRYEMKNIEVAMPLTFQRFLYPQLGLAFRVRSFVLGFDNVFPLFIKKNTYGVNVYFNLGISLFNNRACRVKSSHVDYCPPKLKGPKRKTEKGGGGGGNKKRKKFLGIF